MNNNAMSAALAMAQEMNRPDAVDQAFINGKAAGAAEGFDEGWNAHRDMIAALINIAALQTGEGPQKLIRALLAVCEV